MKKYKTPAQYRARAKFRRDAIKAAGGPEYEALLVKERAARKLYRVAWQERMRREGFTVGLSRRSGGLFKTWLVSNARKRGRKRGIEATIRVSDLDWPTHCPVLGLKLNYPERSGQRGGQHVQANWPSIDRWDVTKGYVPGNVFVISMRANTIKSNATHEELTKVSFYARHGTRAQGALPELPQSE